MPDAPEPGMADLRDRVAGAGDESLERGRAFSETSRCSSGPRTAEILSPICDVLDKQSGARKSASSAKARRRLFQNHT